MTESAAMAKQSKAAALRRAGNDPGDGLTVAWAIALALVLAAFWPGLELPGQIPREALTLLLLPAAVACGVACGVAWIPGRLAWWRVAPLAGLAALWAVTRFAAPSSERSLVGFDALLSLAPIAIALALMRLPSVFDARLGRALTVAWGALAPIGLAQAWFGWDAFAQAHPPAATFVNRNVAAEALVVSLPLLLARALGAPTRRERGWSALVSGLALAFLVATRARGAWIAAVLSIAIFVLLVLRERRRPTAIDGRVLLVPAALVVIALLVPVKGAEPLPSVRTTIATATRPGAGSGAVRVVLARNTLAMIGDHSWLGVGPGRFPVMYPLYRARAVPDERFGLDHQPEHVENDLLEIAAEWGVPVALGVLGLLLLAIWRSLTQRGLDAAARATALIGVAVLSCVAFPLHSPASALIAWAFVGRAYTRAPDADSSTLPGWAWILVVPLTAALLAAYVLPAFASQRDVHDAVVANGADRCPEALAAVERIAAHPVARRRDIGIAAAVAFACTDDPSKTLPIIDTALAVQPHQLNLLLLSGRRRLAAGDAAGAEAPLRQSVEIDPHLGTAWLLLAMSADARRDGAGKDAACRQARAWAADVPETALVCGAANP